MSPSTQRTSLVQNRLPSRRLNLNLPAFKFPVYAIISSHEVMNFNHAITLIPNKGNGKGAADLSWNAALFFGAVFHQLTEDRQSQTPASPTSLHTSIAKVYNKFSEHDHPLAEATQELHPRAFRKMTEALVAAKQRGCKGEGSDNLMTRGTRAWMRSRRVRDFVRLCRAVDNYLNTPHFT